MTVVNRCFVLVVCGCFALAAFSMGCEEKRTAATGSADCNPGEVRSCTCSDGSQREQVCLFNGTEYSACPCDGGSDTNTDDRDSEPSANEGTTDIDDGDTGGQTDDADTDTGDDTTEAPTDEDGTNPDVGEECDTDNACKDELSCFAGYCMDNLGSFQWEVEQNDQIDAMAIDSTDSIYVAGIREEEKSGDVDPNDSKLKKIFITKLGPDGIPVWTKEFGGQGIRNSVADMVVDGDDTIYLIGQTGESLDGETDPSYMEFMYIAKYDAAGNRDWIVMNSMPGPSARRNGAFGVDLDSDNNPWVAGTISNNKMFMAKFDKVSGALQSVKEFCAANTYSYGKDIVVDKKDDSVFVVGMDDSNAVLYKFNGAGEELWREEWKTLNSLKDDPTAMTMGTDGNLYVVGNNEVEEAYQGACGISMCTDVFVTKIDPELGRVKWTTYLSQFPTVDHGLDILAHPNGKIYITGGMFSDIVLIPFYGEAVWQQIAGTDAQSRPRLYVGETDGFPPDHNGASIGKPRDFVYDSTDSPSMGITHGLYNKQGAKWELVAAEAGVGGKGMLHISTDIPEDTSGAIWDFYYKTDTNRLYEKAPYSRAEILHFASGEFPDEPFDVTDYAEQGNAIAVDSKGNIFIAGRTYGDFMRGTNPSTGHAATDGLLIKYIP